MNHRNSRLKFFALLTIFPALVLSESQAAERGDVRDVQTIDELESGGPYRKIWEPYLAKWTDTHYVAAYGLELNAKVDMGDIVCSISRDKGKTWSERIFVFDHRQRNGSVQYAYNNSILFRPPGQDVLWLFAQRVPLHYRDSENADLCAAYSADGGYSWQPVELAVDYQGPLIVVAGIETVVRNGATHYLLPAHRNTRRHDPYGDRRQFVLESTSLLHWKLAGYVPLAKGDEVFLHEGNIARNMDGGDGDTDGELKIVMRTADMQRERPLDPALAYSSISKDGGRTWSEARAEPQLPNHRAKSFFGVDNSRRQIYVYNDSADRRGLLYKLREPGGEWSDARTFYDENNRNSYPTLIEERPNVWLAVWDSSNDPDRKRTAIRFGRLDLSR